jgi:hypothetical protein
VQLRLFQVVTKLRSVNPLDVPDRLDFEDNDLLDQEIQSKAACEANSFVRQR